MQIILYKCMSPNNYLTKNLTNQVILNGALRDTSSIINPEILIENNNPSSYNYLYIPDFKRFYFVNKIDSIRTDLWILYCHVDVLNTYRSEIIVHQAIIDKTQSSQLANMYIDDDDWVVENRKFIETISFPVGLDNDGEFILITAGG